MDLITFMTQPDAWGVSLCITVATLVAYYVAEQV